MNIGPLRKEYGEEKQKLSELFESQVQVWTEPLQKLEKLCARVNEVFTAHEL